MSDSGEQGLDPSDPAQRAGIGGGIVPDDQTEGQESAVEPAVEPAANSGGRAPAAGDNGERD